MRQWVLLCVAGTSFLALEPFKQTPCMAWVVCLYRGVQPLLVPFLVDVSVFFFEWSAYNAKLCRLMLPQK